MMMNEYRNERSLDVRKHKYRTALNWGRIKGVIATERKWMRTDGHKNYNELHGLKTLEFICIYVTALSVCLRCSCSPINRVASISVSCLHAKNSQACIWDSDSPSKLRHTGIPRLTHSKISQLCGHVNNISVYTHAYHMPDPELYFGHSHISSHLPFHSSGIYVSLLLPPPAAPWTPRRQQAAGLSGCRTLWDGTDDNLCPPRGLARDRKIDRKAEWRDREEERKTRDRRSERS